ncbi:dipeptidase [Brevibacillus dissolubilis]|uniref:dipeptidase n=1 Tax=Brevibacillus dissolubilis TaxID=1844116 RepID=UPI00111638FA|nr:dipeptidase [Brevibacillus dissolubilis]
MNIFDAHCDALSKLWEHKELSFYQEDERLQVSFPEMEQAKIGIQVFASYVPTRIRYGQKFQAALEMIDIFHDKVISPDLMPIYTRNDLDECVLKGKKGAILFVEGAHPLEESLTNLRTLYRLGVRGMGLTWNFRNEVADGCEEPNPSGLSLFGRKVIKEMNQLGMMIDVSHVAEPGFWDTLELSKTPVIASHSNVRALHDHPRNLRDEQIKALIQSGGVIGLSFVDFFYTRERRDVTVDDVLRHLDYVCSLGGVDHVAFGSDFDGIETTFQDLTSAKKYTILVDELHKRYTLAEVDKFLSKNWLRVFRTVLQ